MTDRDFIESTVEQLALEWLAGAGWQVSCGPGAANTERSNYEQV